ncbi:MAG TPA: SCO family protein [Thermoanaerobaculia bacterium]|nr:SCO family protein [Thermoanaerobaculia bacterium]
MIAAVFMAAWLHATAATELPPVTAQRIELAGPIPDVEVVDHEGQKHRFYTDLVRGKTVVVNAIYTRCTNVCPLLGHSFRELQTALGDRLGDDVHLISISRDPENDTPETLAAWRRRFEGKPGWTFVTGEKKAIDAVLELLTGDPSYLGGHSAIALFGDDATGIWLRDYGAAEPERYQHLLRYLAETRSAQAVEPP